MKVNCGQESNGNEDEEKNSRKRIRNLGEIMQFNRI